MWRYMYRNDAKDKLASFPGLLLIFYTTLRKLASWTMVHHIIVAATHTQYTCNRFEALVHRPPQMIHSSTDYLSNTCTFVRVERERKKGGWDGEEGGQGGKRRREGREEREGRRGGKRKGRKRMLVASNLEHSQHHCQCLDHCTYTQLCHA